MKWVFFKYEVILVWFFQRFIMYGKSHVSLFIFVIEHICNNCSNVEWTLNWEHLKSYHILRQLNFILWKLSDMWILENRKRNLTWHFVWFINSELRILFLQIIFWSIPDVVCKYKKIYLTLTEILIHYTTNFKGLFIWYLKGYLFENV